MSKIFDQAVEQIKDSLPEVRQTQIGQWLLDLVDQDQADVQLSVAQQREVRRRIELPVTPVSSQDVEAFFNKLA